MSAETSSTPTTPALVVTHQFPRHRRSVGRARAALREQLIAWGVNGEVADTAELLVSELATNAVAAKTPRGRNIAVRLKLSASALRLEVADASSDLPVVKPVQQDHEGGRGLLLVNALAHKWGVEPRDGVGKTVWALLMLPDGLFQEGSCCRGPERRRSP